MQTCTDFHFANLLLYVAIIQVTNSSEFHQNWKCRENDKEASMNEGKEKNPSAWKSPGHAKRTRERQRWRCENREKIIVAMTWNDSVNDVDIVWNGVCANESQCASESAASARGDFVFKCVFAVVSYIWIYMTFGCICIFLLNGTWLLLLLFTLLISINFWKKPKIWWKRETGKKFCVENELHGILWYVRFPFSLRFICSSVLRACSVLGIHACSADRNWNEMVKWEWARCLYENSSSSTYYVALCFFVRKWNKCVILDRTDKRFIAGLDDGGKNRTFLLCNMYLSNGRFGFVHGASSSSSSSSSTSWFALCSLRPTQFIFTIFHNRQNY